MHKSLGLKNFLSTCVERPEQHGGYFLTMLVRRFRRIFFGWFLARDLEKGRREYLAGKTQHLDSMKL